MVRESRGDRVRPTARTASQSNFSTTTFTLGVEVPFFFPFFPFSPVELGDAACFDSSILASFMRRDSRSHCSLRVFSGKPTIGARLESISICCHFAKSRCKIILRPLPSSLRNRHRSPARHCRMLVVHIDRCLLWTSSKK